MYTQGLINDLYYQIIQQYEDTNADCKKLSELILDNFSLLSSISPVSLLNTYHILSYSSPEESFYDKLVIALGEEMANTWSTHLEKTINKTLSISP